MNEQSVAHRYAKAIFELALESKDLDRVEAGLKLASEVIRKTPELLEKMESPSLKKEDRLALVQRFISAAGITGIVANAIGLLTERSRFSLIPSVAEFFGQMKDAHEGILRGTVVSAKPLSSSELTSIQESLCRNFGKRVLMESKTDSALIGGVVVEIAGKTIDGSVQGQLKTLSRILKSDWSAKVGTIQGEQQS